MPPAPKDPNRVEIIESGIDYLTVTTKSISRGKMAMAEANALAAAAREAGAEVRHWTWQSYAGFTLPGLSYGRRADGTIVRLSSATADQHWRTFLRLADNVTRLDLQTTAIHHNGTRTVAREARGTCIAAGEGHDHWPGVTLVCGHPHGDTLYIGSRKSDVFIRIYDKCAESKGIYKPGAWRYELEFKRQPARDLAHSLAATTAPRTVISQLIYDRLTHRGVRPAWERPSGSLRVKQTRVRSSDETRLEWMADTVAPAVRSLLRRVPKDDVYRALGLLPDGTH